jgi:pimeloyl-ACP methyl ester carboxylesterase
MKIKAVDLFFEDQGLGMLFMLVHGYPLSHKIWNRVVPLLSSHNRVIAPDLRGLGNSPATDESYSMQLLAEDLVRLMDRIKVNQTVLAGHSMGGYVCLEFARSFPDRISGLAMVASQAAPDTPEKRLGRLVSIEEVKKNGINPIAISMLPRLTDHVELTKELKEIMLSASPLGVIGCLEGIADRADAREWLPKIKIPTLIIAGKRDSIIPISCAYEMVKLLPDSELVILDNSCHLPMMEQPEETAAALLSLVHRIEQK